MKKTGGLNPARMGVRLPTLLVLAVATPAFGEDPTHDRRVAAFVGGMVADAAAMPLHWIYDTSEIASILKAAVSVQCASMHAHTQ